LDVRVAPHWGPVVGHAAWGANGHSRGFGSYGCHNASAAGCNVRGIGVGVRSGGGHEGNGEEGGRGGIRLVDKLTGACKIEENSDSKKCLNKK